MFKHHLRGKRFRLRSRVVPVIVDHYYHCEVIFLRNEKRALDFVNAYSLALFSYENFR